MDEIEKRLPKTVFMLVDEKGVVQYCNINNTKVVKEFLQRFNITELLNTNDFIKKEIGNYIITADKLSIEGKLLWLVTIEREDYSLTYRDFSTGLYNRNYWEHNKKWHCEITGRNVLFDYYHRY